MQKEINNIKLKKKSIRIGIIYIILYFLPIIPRLLRFITELSILRNSTEFIPMSIWDKISHIFQIISYLFDIFLIFLIIFVFFFN
jgi:hypothetical protein